MAKFTIKHNIISNKANELNINNFPGVDNEKDPCLTYDYIINNLQLLHQNCITPLMEAFDGNIAITSAYRCMELNRAIGGNKNSQHIRGNAVDIISLKYDSSLIWNWCFQNLPSWHQLIWEYPERSTYNNNSNFSWVHISWIEGNNPKTTSVSSTRPDIHEMYQAEKTKKVGNYTHNIMLADQNLI